jgi:hypothetical protein
MSAVGGGDVSMCRVNAKWAYELFACIENACTEVIASEPS